jgi:hypothetical protein
VFKIVNANQNHHEISPHTVRMLLSKRDRVGEVSEKTTSCMLLVRMKLVQPEWAPKKIK